MRVPCQNCERRETLCHASCEEYLAYRAVHEKRRLENLNMLGLKGFTADHEKRSTAQRVRLRTWNRR